MSKTLGNIFADARQNYRLANGFHKTRCYGWEDMFEDERASEEAAANAIIEECAKVLEDLDCNANDPCDAIRALKSPETDAGEATP